MGWESVYNGGEGYSCHEEGVVLWDGGREDVLQSRFIKRPGYETRITHHEPRVTRYTLRVTIITHHGSPVTI